MTVSTWYFQCPWCEKVYSDNEAKMRAIETTGGWFNDDGRYGDCECYHGTCPHCHAGQTIWVEYLEQYDIKGETPGNKTIGQGTFNTSVLLPQPSGSAFNADSLFRSLSRRIRKRMNKTI